MSPRPEARPPSPYPVPNATVPFWRSDPHRLDTFRSSDELPTSPQDVVIIGAGFSGASAAYHLLEGNPALSLTILEAREVCSGATGRNGTFCIPRRGHVRPDLHEGIVWRSELHGAAAAEEVADFEAANLRAVADLVRKEDIRCDFRLCESVTVLKSREMADKVSGDLGRLQARGGARTANLVRSVPGEAAEHVSGVTGAQGAVKFEAASMWPYKLVAGLLDKVVGQGALLFTETPVLRVSGNGADGSSTVHTSRGQVVARNVIFASNGYTASLLPQYGGKIIPSRGVCSRIVRPPGESLPEIPGSLSIRHGPGLYDYQISRPDGSVVVGGARTELIPRVDQWYGVFDDSALGEAAEGYFDGFVQRTYRGWEGSGARVDSVWTGIMGYTTDLHPHVGPVPGARGQIICAGFNGHGMSLALLCAKGLARMVLDGATFADSGIPRLFETTKERLESEENMILG